MPTSNAAKPILVKIGAIAVAVLCVAVSACNKRGEETVTKGDEYSGQFPSATSDSDQGSSVPSAVADSQLPGMAPAYSASTAS